LYSSRILVLLIRDVLLEMFARRVIAVSTASPWSVEGYTASSNWLSGPTASKMRMYRVRFIDW